MKDLNALVRDFGNAVKAAEKVVADGPRMFGVEAIKAIKDNFRWQAYDSGVSYSSWQARKAATNIAYSANRGKGGTSRYKGSVFNARNPLLQQTRNLYNNIHAEIKGGKTVFIGVNLLLVPYADAHNEGLNNQPQRQYMPTPSQGANPKMIKAFSAKFDERMDAAMKDFKK